MNLRLISPFIFTLLISFFAIGGEKAEVIGGYFNSGFENLTCSQMISQNLARQIKSAQAKKAARQAILNKCQLNSFSKKLWDQINSGKQAAACRKALDDFDSIIQTETEFFLAAVKLRMELYDALNLTKAGGLIRKTCTLNSQNTKRPEKMEDWEYVQKLSIICALNVYDEKGLQSQYQNATAFKDRQVCQKFFDDYQDSKNERFAVAKKPEAAAEAKPTERQCKPVADCAKFLKTAINIQGACYQQAIVDCYSGGEGVEVKDSAPAAESRRGGGTQN